MCSRLSLCRYITPNSQIDRIIKGSAFYVLLTSVRAEGRGALFGSPLELQVVPSEHVLQGETGHGTACRALFFLHILRQARTSKQACCVATPGIFVTQQEHLMQ